LILVIKASAGLAWLFQRSSIEEAARADALLEALENASAWIPSLWYTEVANALLTAERRNMLSQAQSTDFINRL
jgi:predicted nucleic acid-binding protein